MAPDLAALLSELVAIPSESGEEAEFLSHLAKLFEKEIAANCEFDNYGNLIAKVPAKGSQRSRPVLLGLHGDTVVPGRDIKAEVVDGLIRSQGPTILGADDKAGIVEAIAAVSSAETHPELEIVVTRQEEVGMLGARNLDYTRLHADLGFLLDSDELDGIVIGGPSHMFIDIEIQGRSAHAGLEPEKGVSAIHAAAYAIASVKEGRLDSETTVNVGTIRGGEVRNAVPAQVRIQAEVRSLNHDKCLNVSEEVKAAFVDAATAAGAQATVDMSLAYEAVSIPPTEKVVELAKRAVSAAGLDARLLTICGGTDASIYNRKGIPSVALGTGVQNPHTLDEQIAVADMEKVVSVVRGLLEAL